MVRHTHETLVISALLNSLDATAAKDYGITALHFRGFRDEYEWLLAYNETYGRCPNVDEMLVAFPDFPYSEKTDGAYWPSFELKRTHGAQELQQRIERATDSLIRGDVEGAYAEFEGAQLELVSEKPVNLLVDHAYLDDYDAPAEIRVPMPWPSLQQVTNGIGPGELWYLGARQGQGKSNLLIEIAKSAVLAGFNVCFYSLEMTKRQLQVRMHTSLGHTLGTRVDAKAMLHRQFDKAAYKTLLQRIEAEVPGEMMIHEAAMGRVSPGVVANRASEFDLTIIDYVGLMYTDEQIPAIKDYRAMAEISNQLKEIALSKHTRVIGAAQINREGDTYGKRPPRIRTLAQSDHLGNDGDVVLTMKRYGLATVMSPEKNRHGDSERLFYTNFRPNSGNFTEIDAETAEEIRMEAEMD